MASETLHQYENRLALMFRAYNAAFPPHYRQCTTEEIVHHAAAGKEAMRKYREASTEQIERWTQSILEREGRQCRT